MVTLTGRKITVIFQKVIWHSECKKANDALMHVVFHAIADGEVIQFKGQYVPFYFDLILDFGHYNLIVDAIDTFNKELENDIIMQPGTDELQHEILATRVADKDVVFNELKTEIGGSIMYLLHQERYKPFHYHFFHQPKLSGS